VNAVVEYFGSLKSGRYTVFQHQTLDDHPNPPTPEEAAEAYPDGVAYCLWPADLPRKFGLRHYTVDFARRTSFTVVSLPANEAPPGGTG
jgi:hypothetical protein